MYYKPNIFKIASVTALILAFIRLMWLLSDNASAYYFRKEKDKQCLWFYCKTYDYTFMPLPSSSTSLNISSRSASEGLCPIFFSTSPSSCVVIVPSPSLSNTLKASLNSENEPRHEKANILHMRKQTQISFAVSAFVFATYIVQSFFFLNPKFQASSHLLWLHSLVCFGPGRKP